MLNVLLLSALLAGPQGDVPGQHGPVFHAEAYVVTLSMSFEGGWSKRLRGLTSADFQATINQEPVALDVSEDPHKPAHYLLSINPPIELRDGKSHRIDVKFRNGDKWRDFPFKWTATFEKPGRPGW
jgi:hypothetical protein